MSACATSRTRPVQETTEEPENPQSNTRTGEAKVRHVETQRNIHNADHMICYIQNFPSKTYPGPFLALTFWTFEQRTCLVRLPPFFARLVCFWTGPFQPVRGSKQRQGRSKHQRPRHAGFCKAKVRDSSHSLFGRLQRSACKRDPKPSGMQEGPTTIVDERPCVLIWDKGFKPTPSMPLRSKGHPVSAGRPQGRSWATGFCVL